MLALDRESDKPLHKQLYDGFCAAILQRSLLPGQRVPATRTLAVELRVSRIPVLNAYAQLLAEGYFEARAGSGTFVSRSLPNQWMSLEVEGRSNSSPIGQFAPRALSKKSALLSYKPDPWTNRCGAFIVGQPALEHFPFKVWSSLLNRHIRSIRVASHYYGDAMGCVSFRTTLADYLRTARAVKCEPNQIMIVNGSQHALELCARVLLDQGDRVWIEEPGYRLARRVFVMAGCRLVPVPVDQEGLNVTKGIKQSPKARVAFVTPSHQFPLGVTMSVSRRLQLLDWAERSGAWIIEDDYDSEYRYDSLPIASLQGLDHNSRVIYVGTFSKTLFPSLRLGYIVIPPDLVSQFCAVRQAMDVFPPHLYQAALNDFISEGHFARHIRRTRLLYAERRNLLVEAIHNEFAASVDLHGADAGVHLALTLPSGRRDTAVCKRAAQEDLWLWPLSGCYLEKPSQGFILGFGSTTPQDIPKGVANLRAIVGSQ